MSRQRSLIFWPVPRRKDREHSWKHHARARTLLYELLGWIDEMAARRETETGYRFVFAKRKTLLTKCFKGKRAEGKHFNIRKLDSALAELREQHIISQYFETVDGCGFVVAPHDSLCRGDSKTCLLPNRAAWQFVDQKPDWRNTVLDALKTAARRQHDGSENGSVTAVKTAVKTAAVPSIDGSQNGSQNGSSQSLYDANFALLTEAEKADWLTNGMQLGASTRVSRVSRLAEVSAYPSDPRVQSELQDHHEFLEKHVAKRQEQHQEPEQKRRAADASSLGDKTDEEQRQPREQPRAHVLEQGVEFTIGAHFANATDIIDRLTDGELDQGDYHCSDGFEDWSLLSDCAIAAVDAKKERPYLGLQTNALLMRDTMKRLKKLHKLNTPEPWLPIMDAMQGVTRAQRLQKKAEAVAVKSTFTEKELEKLREEALRDRAPCQETDSRTGAGIVINRTPEERIANGFTVLAPCTVKGGDSQGQFGKAVWHKATE